MTIFRANQALDKLRHLNIDPVFFAHHIQPLLQNRKENTERFHLVFKQFVSYLETHNLFSLFLESLNQLRAQGILQTHQSPSQFKYVYHDSPHAAEIADDVGNLLKQFYAKSDDSPAYIAAFIALTQAAAAFHDVVQGKKLPMQNEKLSAALFAKSVTGTLQNTLPHHHFVTDFISLLPFISNELIVVSTYLLRPHTKPLLFFLNQLDDNPQQLSHNFLAEGCLAISLCDTSRSLVLDLLKQQVKLNQLNELSSEQRKAIDLLFSQLHSELDSDEKRLKQEAFLLRMGQSLRMFPELAQQFATLTEKQIESFITAMQLAHTDADAFAKLDLSDFFSLFLNNISGEINFSEKLNNDDHLKIAKDIHCEKWFARIEMNMAGWADHLADLEKLKLFYENQDKDTARQLASALIYLAAQQPGRQIMMNDPLFSGKK